MQPVQPIFVTDLFAPLHAELLTLLESLTPAQWELPTVAALWTVRDMVAHLLDTDIKRLSYQRDGLPSAPSDTSLDTFRDIVEYIDHQNAAWVAAAQRFSPRVLIDLHGLMGPQVHTFFRNLDPMAPASISVGWAGEAHSSNWFDTAREYTEKWHHQQHIRLAVGAPLLNERRWLHPALDTFSRALPYTYHDVNAPVGTALVVDVTGDAGDTWTLMREATSDKKSAWRLYQGRADNAAAHVILPDDSAWRLFTRGITAEAARPHVRFAGNTALGEHLLGLLAIMA